MDYVICYYNNAGTCFIYIGDVTSLGMTSPAFSAYSTSLAHIETFSTYQAALAKANVIEGTVNTFPLKVCRLVDAT